MDEIAAIVSNGSVPFDSERDCSEPDVVQDIRVGYINGVLCIEQPDGAGEAYHFVAVPDHMISGFIQAVAASLAGGGDIMVSGIPPK